MNLTDKQRERLTNREKPEYASVKRSNDYLVREILKDFLNLDDIMLILKHLPKEQIEKVVTYKHINNLLLLVENLSCFVGAGENTYYEVPINTGETTEFINVFAVDKKRDIDLDGHIAALKIIQHSLEVKNTMFEGIELQKKNRVKVPFKQKRMGAKQ